MRNEEKRFEIGILLLLVALLFVSGQLSDVLAGENYGTNYAGGNEDFMMGALPPADTSIFINYLVSYNSSTLRDNAGRTQSLTAPPLGNPKVDFKINVLVDALRFIQVTKVKVFGGDLLWHVILPVGYQKLSMSAGPVDMGSQSKYGLGDIEAGVGIAWHPCKTFHHAAGWI
ncbi:MAG: hypothetical protein A4E63_02112 [Syntrophorhabdus sp. PtaU1.Bin050]|nr:MAG: hypothetical protein A4E63_02112 [Syntrophorhabdus sp. PtaU1.Bin050]